MTDTIRWGILGPGSIARKFAKGLQEAVPGAKLVAVGSRDMARAEKFATEFGVPHKHGSYEALAADPHVDAVYVATPHTGHAAHTILCLEHGKAVLVEKPFAVNAEQARRMVAAAREQKRFLMEAMWTRFLPATAQVRNWIAEGAIGEPRLVTADFGFRGDWNPESRLLAPALAGGALLDVGVYTIAYACMVFQDRPEAICGLADIGKSGVDEQAGIVLRFPRGRMAILTCAVRTNTPHVARIDGTEGRIEVPRFWSAAEATLHVNGKEPRLESKPFESTGYGHEAVAMGECMRAGQLESKVMPLDESVAIMEIMDDLRQQWGLRYPGE